MSKSRLRIIRAIIANLAVLPLLVANLASSASVSPVLAKAKQDAEARGMIFETSRDGIIANAKKFGIIFPRCPSINEK